MRLKVCKKCGKVFQSDTGKHSSYMCPECALNVKRESVYRERICKSCGMSFWGFPRSFYCPDCLEKRKKEQKHRYNTQPSIRPLGSVDKCQKCGKEYIVNSGMQKYCNECAEEAINIKIKERKRNYAAQNKEAFDKRKEDTRGKRYICVVCGKVFNKTTSTVTCSPECQKELLRINRNKADLKRGKRKLPPDQKYESGLPKSGVIGVTWRKNGKWQATYKSHYIGVYNTINEAKKAIEEYKNIGQG